MKMRMLAKMFLVAVAIAVVYVFFTQDLGRYFTLDYLKSQQTAFASYYQQHTLRTLLIYMGAYVAMAALSLPGATIMTLAGGALFGFAAGTVAVSFASTIGATLALLAARFLFRDGVRARFGERLRAIDAGMAREGAFYLFTLRLIPLFPFFVINLVMGLTAIRTTTFFWVSQLGMLPATLVYVNAGTQLARLDSLQGILSPSLLLSFALLGIFPLVAKKTVGYVNDRQTLRRYPRPQRFDYNLIVIGAGSGGLVTAYIAAVVKAKVALIERHKMGGDCLNSGCVPSKALIRSAKILSYARRAQQFGFKKATVDYDFADVMERVQRVIKTIAPHDSVERYTALGVDCIQGEARVRSPYEVEVNGRVLTTRNIVIATGARPAVPFIPGLEDVGYLTSDTIWDLREKPSRLLMLGGGPIGCELAQAFQRLGVQVTLVQRSSRIMNKEDDEVSVFIAEHLRAEGVIVLLDHNPLAVHTEGETKYLICEHGGNEVKIAFDKLLVALGRRANVHGFGLEELGVNLADNGTIVADPYLRTNYPNIYVCGDVTGPYQFTHTAAHQAWYAAVNALFSPFKQYQADYRVIPRVTYTDPEVACVGINEQEAQAQGIPYEVTHYGIDDLDRAITDEEAHGFVKVLTPPGKDTILGVTIVGAHAGESLAEFVLAMKHGLGLNKILGTVHPYPTLAEANKYAAGAWRRTHAPQGLLRVLARFHAWRRGG